jgi:hypothetical protein
VSAGAIGAAERGKSSDRTQLAAVAARRPGADHQRCYRDDHAHYQQRRIHRPQECGLAELGELTALRANRSGDLQGLSQRVGGRGTDRTGEGRQMLGEDVGISRRQDGSGQRDAEGATDLTGGVVDGRSNPLLLVGHCGHNR